MLLVCFDTPGFGGRVLLRGWYLGFGLSFPGIPEYRVTNYLNILQTFSPQPLVGPLFSLGRAILIE